MPRESGASAVANCFLFFWCRSFFCPLGEGAFGGVMPCYFPLRGFRSSLPNSNGKFPLFDIKARTAQRPAPPGTAAVDIPCGQCIGCRLEHSRRWAMRCLHEASLYSDNCFITLTYNPLFIPAYGALDKSAFPKFMKRMRKRFGSGVRYFHCGEYGDKLGRPHYHACLFNFDFPDKVLWKVANGTSLFTSQILSELWPFGFSSVGDVTFDSAAYVARYIVKKVTGDKAFSHYTVLDKETGELVCRPPEYVTMSRNPGIGSGWFTRFHSDVFPSDFLISRGNKCKPPRYYDSLYEVMDSPGMEAIKVQRAEKLASVVEDATLDRLLVREEVSRAKLSRLKRSYEDG